MHPDISVLPSRVFYDGKLQDGPNMATKTAATWHGSPVFAPYRFFNVANSREVSSGSHSLKNPIEADVALRLYQNIKSQYPGVDFDYRVGIVTMYREQKNELMRKFRSQYGPEITSKVE
jgi:senataxin